MGMVLETSHMGYTRRLAGGARCASRNPPQQAISAVSRRDDASSSKGCCCSVSPCKTTTKKNKRRWSGGRAPAAALILAGCWIAAVQLPVLFLQDHRDSATSSASSSLFLLSSGYDAFFLHEIFSPTARTDGDKDPRRAPITNQSTAEMMPALSPSLKLLNLQSLVRSDHRSSPSPILIFSRKALPDGTGIAKTETTAEEEEVRRQKRQPRLYLHVGPYKTGSTFLQCAMSGDLYNILRSDNVLYLGTCAFECVRRKKTQHNATTGAARPGGGTTVATTTDVSGRKKAGPRDPDAYEFCLGHSGDSLFNGRTNQSLREPLRLKLRELRLAVPPRDAMIAWEFLSDLAPAKLSTLVRELRDQQWDVHVIAHYRPLYEWLPSMFDQLHRPGWNGRSHFMVWPGDLIVQSSRQSTSAAANSKKSPSLLSSANGGEANLIAPPREMLGRHRPHFEWPVCAPSAGTGDSTPSGRFFDDCLRRSPVESRYKAVLQALELSRMHPTEKAIRLWLSHATTITVLDLNQMKSDADRHQAYKSNTRSGGQDGPREESSKSGGGDALIIGLFCNVIPGLNRTCAAVRSGTGAEIAKAGRNVRFDGNNYDWLAVYARERGLYPGGDALQSRSAAQDAVRYHQEAVLGRAHDDFPLACLPRDSLESLRLYSLSLERRFLPGREARHDSTFERLVGEGRFCRIDPQETLKLPEWKRFFKAEVAVGPIVLDRYRRGDWYPPFDATRQSIQEVFYPNAIGRPLKRSAKKIEFVGFILPLPGTGLTKLLDLLTQSNRAMTNHLDSLNLDLGCIFGPLLGVGVGANSSKRSSPALSTSTCRPATFFTLVKQWVKALPNIKESTHTPTEVSNVMQSSLNANVVQALLTPVIMIRDPLDRLVALYGQSGKPGTGDERGSNPIPEDASFASWLESLGSDSERRKVGQYRDQFRSIAADVTRAIKTIIEEPKVLVLIHECAPLSLQLLRERHPSIVDRELVNEAMQSLETYVASNNDTRRVNSERILRLRNMTRNWFESEYRFYDAAAMQFRRLVAVSTTLDSAALEECINVLDRARD